MCPDCSEATDRCRCRERRREAGGADGASGAATAPDDGIVRVGRQSKGRRGKTVTVITGLPLPADQLDDVARELKRRCGVGGTVRGATVEIQGDQRDAVIEALQEKGHRVKVW
jgi:translation initiation factor 1